MGRTYCFWLGTCPARPGLRYATGKNWGLYNLTRCMHVMSSTRSRVSKRNESVSADMQVVSCLSSHFWSVNRLPYFWTRYLACCHVIFFVTMAPRPARARNIHKVCVKPYILIIDLLQTDIQTQPQTNILHWHSPACTIMSFTLRHSAIRITLPNLKHFNHYCHRWIKDWDQSWKS